MKYRNTDPDFGDDQVYTAADVEEIVEEIHPWLVEWAISAVDARLERDRDGLIIDEVEVLKKRFIAQLEILPSEEVTG